jgi:hypothetical protein
MPVNFSTRCNRLRRRFLQATLLLLPGLWLPAAGAVDGRFEVINATARLESDAWLADARVDLELNDEALQALKNGVTLRIAFQYEVSRQRRFWTNEVITAGQLDFELEYLSLSRRYLVRNVPEQTVNSYATLFSALRFLGQLRDVRLIDDRLGNQPARYEFGLRAVLDWQKLPGPLAMLTFWRGDFSLESDWYRWTPKE